MMNFTNDEMNLMCIYQTGDRQGLISALTEMRGYLDEDEAELRELTDSALQKLSEITDEDFCLLYTSIGAGRFPPNGNRPERWSTSAPI